MQKQTMGAVDNHLIASCVRNIGVKNYLNQMIFLTNLQSKMSGMYFFGHGVEPE